MEEQQLRVIHCAGVPIVYGSNVQSCPHDDKHVNNIDNKDINAGSPENYPDPLATATGLLDWRAQPP